MPLERGRRTTGTSAVRRDPGLAARRAALGVGLVGAAGGLAVALGGGFAWALGALVALPGAYTLASALRPFTAACPGCGSTLGGGLLHLPDDPVLARGARDVRCAACGIYVDGTDAGVREVPFNRALESPGYELTLPREGLGALAWGDRCVACGEPAARWLRLAPAAVGIVSGEGAVFESAGGVGLVPYCAGHGDGVSPADRWILAARAKDGATLRLRLYATYRRVLDDHRGLVDVTVRESPS